MPMLTVNLADNRDVQRVVKSAAPDYRKREARVMPTATVTLDGTFWDGGSRSEYAAVELATGRVSSAPQYAPPQFGGPMSAPVVNIPVGIAIVKTGTFCGKPATATVYVNPADVAHMLPAA